MKLILLMVLAMLMAATGTNLRSSQSNVSPTFSFEESVALRSDARLGRELQDGTCLCDDPGSKPVKTIRLMTPGGPGNHFDYNAERYRSRVDAFYERTGIKVEIVYVADLTEINAEMFADAGKGVYDGYSFIPNVIGEVTEAGGLADLTQYVAGSQEVAWTDIFPFNRDSAAVYDGDVRSLPCDGDVHSMFYRKDLFEKYNLAPPRTWDEYTERAKFFHGMEVPAADGSNNTVTLSGSCVERNKNCDIIRNYFIMLVHAATAQAKGTTEGLLFDSATFKPNLGEGLAETLRHLENHAKYGAEKELADDGCQNIAIDSMTDGTCAMSLYWGDIFSRHLYEGSQIEGKLGIAPTPGVTKVLDHETGRLVPCTEETCPFGKDYPDIGRVNYAPFAAAGGWSAGVAEGLPKEREAAMAEFIGFVCGKEESLKDVITDARRDTLATGADPFRKSHFNVDDWVARGYPRETTEQYLNTITEQFNSPNIVLDARFPEAVPLIVSMGLTIYNHLVESKTKPMAHVDRMALATKVEEDWDVIVAEFNKRQPPNGLPLAAQYQKSLNVYIEPSSDSDSDGTSITLILGLVLGCSAVAGTISGLIIYFFSRQKIEEQKRLAEEAERHRQERKDDDSDSYCSVEVDERDETAEILKLSKNETKKVRAWRLMLLLSYVTTAVVGLVFSYRALEGETTRLSSQGFIVALASLFGVVTACFYLYDRSVRRRTEMIVSNAARANAIVTSMFPGQFRDQILEDQENENKNGSGAKSKINTFLENMDNQKVGTKPLADLFLETTVLMADIVGFTPWSSAREPSQVFTLLESLYSAFDVIAVRRGIFKVETVGDCYVAVTGVPDYRKDHATAMARFAHDILERMATLTKQLEVSLGPDTADLTLRIGMHSGPVTAGVLRGDRARFQLFGDTMNTTARMEQNGVPNRVHVSQECADLIAASGKSSWLEKRDTQIVAKGKGVLTTYWVTARPGRGSAIGSSHPSEHDMDVDTGIQDRQERLISWNLDQLVILLKQVVARREAELAWKRKMIPAGTYKIVKDGATLLDDVKEIIELPAYNEKVVSRQANPEDVVISQQVLQEMHHYVSTVCGFYNANAFHNFEHASAVTMSVLKLLSRIVAPASTMDFGDNSSDDNFEAASLHDHTYGITSDPLTQFACAFSAMIHDADHSGVPNAQLVKENAPVATVYGTRSVAEQNSLVICWDLLMKDEYSDFRKTLCATQSELDRFRSLVVNSVLATDIVDKDLKALRNARWDKAFNLAKKAPLVEPTRDSINRKATIVIEHLIQASDVSHTMQHWHIYRKWNERFFRECYAAFKAGRAETDPSINWYKGEIGFFDFYIIPLAKKLKDCGVFGKSSDEFLNYALQNRAEWEDRGQEIVSEMMEAITRATPTIDSPAPRAA